MRSKSLVGLRRAPAFVGRRRDLFEKYCNSRVAESRMIVSFFERSNFLNCKSDSAMSSFCNSRRAAPRAFAQAMRYRCGHFLIVCIFSCSSFATFSQLAPRALRSAISESMGGGFAAFLTMEHLRTQKPRRGPGCSMEMELNRVAATRERSAGEPPALRSADSASRLRGVRWVYPLVPKRSLGTREEVTRLATFLGT